MLELEVEKDGGRFLGKVPTFLLDSAQPYISVSLVGSERW